MLKRLMVLTLFMAPVLCMAQTPTMIARTTGRAGTDFAKMGIVGTRTNFNTPQYLSNGTDTVKSYRSFAYFSAYTTNMRPEWWNGAISSTSTEINPGNSISLDGSFEYGGNVWTEIVTSAGTGYPISGIIPVTFSAPPVGGTIATGYAYANGTGGVGPIFMTDVGSLYTSAPTITVSTSPLGTTATATCTVQAVTYYPYTFNGASSVTIPAGGMAEADALGVDPYPGTSGYWRTCVTVTSGQKWYCGLIGTAMDSYTLGSDATQTTGAMATTSAKLGSLAPVVVLGNTFPYTPGVIILADSRGLGYYDDGTPDQGVYVRACTGNITNVWNYFKDIYGYCQMATASTRASQWDTWNNLFTRLKIFSAADYAIYALGVNDFANSETAAQQEAYATDFIQHLKARGIQTAICTIEPEITSVTVDGCMSLAGQTPFSGDAQRQLYNTYLRTTPNPCGATILFDPAFYTQAPTDPARWNPGTTVYISSTCTSSGGTSVLSDSSQSWSTNQWVGDACYIVSGTDAGQQKTIQSNSANQLTFDSALLSTPDTTTAYEITNAPTQDGTHETTPGTLESLQGVNMSMFNPSL